MAPIRVLIVDDEPLARRGIRQLLARHADVRVVGECRNGREALRALEETAADLVFLDVQMPDLDGLGVIREHGPAAMPAVIFVTAYEEFAVRAFEAQALDYLVKPINEERFAGALQRARERLHLRSAMGLAQQLSSLLAAPPPPAAQWAAARAGVARSGRLTIPVAGGELVLTPDEIDWVEAADYYAAVHVGSKRYLIRESLGSLAARLDASLFVRVHRAALVRVGAIAELRTALPGGSSVILRDGTRIPVSRRQRRRVAARLRG